MASASTPRDSVHSTQASARRKRNWTAWLVVFAVVLLVLVFCIEAGWYALVALVLSAGAPQRLYLAYKAWLDRTAGLVMFGLGLKLVTGAVRP